MGKLAASEYTGGSFTISNLGMFGVREFAAVINPPHGGILAVGAGEQRPIVIDGNLAVATVMSVTLSADHRAVDGAVGARWLQAFKGLSKILLPCFCEARCCFNSPRNKPIARVPVRRLGDKNDRYPI